MLFLLEEVICSLVFPHTIENHNDRDNFCILKYQEYSNNYIKGPYIIFGCADFEDYHINHILIFNDSVNERKRIFTVYIDRPNC